MKISLLFAAILCFSTTISQAQGGIGNKPRTDLVMLPAEERDSIANEVLARIQDLKRFAETGNQDSAAMIIGFKGAKEDSSHWTRAVKVSEPLEKDYVATVLTKISKTLKASPEMHPKYFAIFKEKSTPSGRKYLYQIDHSDGKHSRMISWTFYGNGDKLILGDFN